MLKILWRQHKNFIKIYKLDGCTWNWFLDKYYPTARVILEIEKLKRKRK